MKASNVRFVLFSLVFLAAIVGPGPGYGTQQRALHARFGRLPRLPRGVGCGGGGGVRCGGAPKMPKFEPQMPKFEPPPRFAPPGEGRTVHVLPPRDFARPNPPIPPVPPRPPIPPEPPGGFPGRGVPPIRQPVILPVPIKAKPDLPVQPATEAADEAGLTLQRLNTSKDLDAVGIAVAKKNPEEVDSAVGRVLDRPEVPGDVKQSLRDLLDRVRDLRKVEVEIAGIEAGGLRKPPSLPVPEPPGGTKVGQLEKPTEGLPPLTGHPVKDLPTAVQAATQSSCRGLRRYTDDSWERIRVQVAPLTIHSTRLLDQLRKRDRDEQERDGLVPGQRYSEVEKHLNRPLSSAERQMVPTMLRQGKTPEEIAKILGRP
jgi:hypothetical protein